MTRDEILNLEAGREMDALIAEKVMGEKQPNYVHANLHMEYPETSTCGNWQCFNIFEHGDICEWHPKQFSTDISAAWEVVEMMGDKFDNVGHGEEWYCVYRPDEWGNIVYADSAPLAICRAALLAVTEEGE